MCMWFIGMTLDETFCSFRNKISVGSNDHYMRVIEMALDETFVPFRNEQSLVFYAV